MYHPAKSVSMLEKEIAGVSVRMPDFDTVIFSPVLETSLYLGRVLNAPVLPVQYLAWEHSPDPLNPTRRWSIPNLAAMGGNYRELKPIPLERARELMADTLKTTVKFI